MSNKIEDLFFKAEKELEELLTRLAIEDVTRKKIVLEYENKKYKFTKTDTGPAKMMKELANKSIENKKTIVLELFQAIEDNIPLALTSSNEKIRELAKQLQEKE